MGNWDISFSEDCKSPVVGFSYVSFQLVYLKQNVSISILLVAFARDEHFLEIVAKMLLDLLQSTDRQDRAGRQGDLHAPLAFRVKEKLLFANKVRLGQAAVIYTFNAKSSDFICSVIISL